jgi:hypothetical protein
MYMRTYVSYRIEALLPKVMASMTSMGFASIQPFLKFHARWLPQLIQELL